MFQIARIYKLKFAYVRQLGKFTKRENRKILGPSVFLPVGRIGFMVFLDQMAIYVLIIGVLGF